MWPWFFTSCSIFSKVLMSTGWMGFSSSPSYLSSRYVLVANVSGRVRDRSALKGKCLGVAITDLEVLQTDEKFVESLGSVTYQTNTEGLFQALLSGEVDGILVSSVVAAYYMNII